jgi:hypothetical protein
MIHGNPSNSTPIFQSARATPDGKLAYDLLYVPSIVTLSQTRVPDHGHVASVCLNSSRLVQNLESSISPGATQGVWLLH